MAYILAGNIVAKTTEMIRPRFRKTVKIVDLFRTDVVRGNGSGKLLFQCSFKNQIVSSAFSRVTIYGVKKIARPAATGMKNVLAGPLNFPVFQSQALSGLKKPFPGSNLDTEKAQPVGQIDVIIVPDEKQVVRGEGHRDVHLFSNGSKPLGYVHHLDIGVIERKTLTRIVIQDD